MTDIAKHIRIFNSTPDDDFVTKRTLAIDSIEEAFSKKTFINDILQLANDIAIAIQSPKDISAFITENVERCLKEQSTSFVADGQQLQIITCALIAAVRYLENRKKTNSPLSLEDVFGIGLWSALSFQTPVSEKQKVESLRLELLEQSQEVISTTALSSRLRNDIKKIKPIAAPADLASLAASLESAYGKAIEAMRTNSSLDREELDILWWVLGDWSKIAKKKIGEMNQLQSAVISSIEISQLLRRVPSEAHRNLACRLLKSNDLIDGAEFLKKMGELTGPLSDFLKEFGIINQNPAVFPVFTMIIAGSAKTPACKLKRYIDEWAGRILLEGSMINLSAFLNDNGQ